MNSVSVPNVLFACLIGILPGPPGFKIENNYFQAYPIDKTKCTWIDPRRDIIYKLYTRNNPEEPRLLKIDNDRLLRNSGINFSDPTVIFFHGYLESSFSPNAIEIRNVYIQRGTHNVIIVDAQRVMAGPWYYTSARNTYAVGQYTARFIDYLVSKGLNLTQLHLVGASLGAQMAGNTGSNLKSGRIVRITGLDPAGPLFTKWPNSMKLDRGDAEYVDVIHTDAGIFGYPRAVGHADFWPNRGLAPQPGCLPSEIKQRNPNGISEQIFCSHWRAYQYYAESVLNNRAFVATQCSNWVSFNLGICNLNRRVNMGFSLPYGTRGTFYLKTNESPPYSIES